MKEEREKKQKERREGKEKIKTNVPLRSFFFLPTLDVFPSLPSHERSSLHFSFPPPFINPSFRYPFITFIRETFLDLYSLSLFLVLTLISFLS